MLETACPQAVAHWRRPALRPLRTMSGWRGIAGKIPQEPLAKATRNAGYKVVPVALSETERDEFYYGYSNEVIWPLFHDLQNFCSFDPAFWETYKTVNVRYADAIADCAHADDFIWVHDYHLMYAGQALRERSVRAALTFFLHIPFPPYDIFSKNARFALDISRLASTSIRLKRVQRLSWSCKDHSSCGPIFLAVNWSWGWTDSITAREFLNDYGRTAMPWNAIRNCADASFLSRL